MNTNLCSKITIITVAVLPVTFNWSVNENPDIVFSYKTVSALKLDNKPESIPSAS